jgi:mannose-6-phosphate isomerase-like protein (cupin superfamily)
MTSIKYDSPEFEERPKVSLRIWNSDLLSISAQKIRDGGETNLHSHTATDEAWYILAGRARFYGSDPADKWEFGPNEGAYVPAGTPYWFESASDEPLELLRFGATLPDVEKERVNYENLRGWQQGYLGGRDAGPDDKR